MPSTLDILVNALKDISNHTPAFDGSRCINLRHSQAGQCTICADICPMAAVTLDPAPQFDPGVCLGCDACTAACPTSALRGRLSPLEILHDACQSAQQGRVTLACQAVSTRDDAATRITCISALTVEFYVGLALSSIDHITIYSADCADCPLQFTLSQIPDAITGAEQVLSCLGLSLDVKQQVGRPPVNTAPSAGVSRREFFTRLVKKQISSDIEKLQMWADAVGWRHALVLANLFQNHAAIEGVALPVQAGQWGAVTLDARCIGCQMCASFCPTGALATTVEESDGTVTISFCAARCTACGLCKKVCFKHAVAINNTVDLIAIAACKYVSLWNGTPALNPLSNMAKKGENSVMRTFIGNQK